VTNVALGVGYEVTREGLCLIVLLCEKPVWSRGQESNLYLSLRRASYYPLYYREMTAFYTATGASLCVGHRGFRDFASPSAENLKKV
jgi:hypothetical protein